MQIQLSDHFDYNKLLRFTLPSIAMMVFLSIYGVVDGFFVSNFVDKEAFTAVNFIFPFIMMFSAIGFMFGTGGSAYISKLLGEGKSAEANRTFTMLTYINFLVGCVIAVVGVFIVGPVAEFLGAEGRLLEDSITYGRILLIAMPAFMLQNYFQSLFITAEKPKLGLYITLAAGITNMVLDALLIAVFRFGIVGAALATTLAQCVGGIIPLFYFIRENTSLLRFVPAMPDLAALWRISVNGFSELLSNISMSVVGMLYNTQLLFYAGDNGVAAYGVLMYVNFIFIAIFIGYAIGIAPVVGFHFGAGNKKELRSILIKSVIIIGAASVVMFAVAECLAGPLAYIFVGYDAELAAMTVRGFHLSAFSFLFAGFAILSSSYFTALSDGITSAIISFARTIIFQCSLILILPPLFSDVDFFSELDGIWLSVPLSELLALIVGAVFLIVYKNRFGYGKRASEELPEIKG